MNLVVIGAGPAGEAAAKTAACKGAAVTLVEKEFVGGVCLNWGCIPSKALLSFGKKIRDLKKIPGIKSPFRPDNAADRNSIWTEMRKEKDRVIQTLRSDDEKSIRLSGAKILTGEARFSSSKTLEVSSKDGKQTLSFDKAIVAVGSVPVFPPPLDDQKKAILDSDRIFDVETLPESIAIVGGGAVGCEFACLFHELGCKVTLIEKTSNLLPGEDPQIVSALRKSFEARGIAALDSVTVEKMEKKDGLWSLDLTGGKKLEAQEILACVGRRARADGIDPDKAGIRHSKKGIEVDANLRTSNPDVYAVGDVNGLSLLAHAGAVQGEIAAGNSLGENRAYDGSLIPRCLYTWPEVASVGQWNHQAQEKGIETKAQRFFFQASGRALAENDPEGFVQIISDKGSGLILGGQIIGPHATELIHVIAVALKSKMTRADLKEVIFAHPTFSEGIKAALDR